MWYIRDMFDDLAELRNVVNSFIKEKKAEYAGTPIPVNVYENEDKVLVAMPLAGVNKDNIEINYENNSLLIKTKKLKEVREEIKTIRKEIVDEEDYTRTIKMNTPIKSDTIAAKYENGILFITIDKKEEAKPKKVAIE